MKITIPAAAANQKQPQSVGCVCSCGLALASIPGYAAACSGCGTVWLISAMDLSAAPIFTTDYVYGAHIDGLHDTP